MLLQCTWRACPTYERKFLQKVITPVKEVESATGAQQCQLALAIPPTIPVAPTVPVALTDGSNSSASTAMDTVSCDGAGPCRSSHAVASRKKPVTFSASALSSRTARQVDTRRRMATVRYLPKVPRHWSIRIRYPYPLSISVIRIRYPDSLSISVIHIRYPYPACLSYALPLALACVRVLVHTCIAVCGCPSLWTRSLFSLGFLKDKQQTRESQHGILRLPATNSTPCVCVC